MQIKYRTIASRSLLRENWFENVEIMEMSAGESSFSSLTTILTEAFTFPKLPHVLLRRIRDDLLLDWQDVLLWWFRDTMFSVVVFGDISDIESSPTQPN